MVNLVRNFLITVALFSRRKQVKPYRGKAVTVRPAECKQGKSFLVFMRYMVIYPRKELHGFTPVPFDDRVIQDKYLDTFRSGKPAECTGHFGGKEQQKLRPVKRSVIQKTVVSVFGNSLFFPFGVQETEKVLALKH